jgi:hypothetical protein
MALFIAATGEKVRVVVTDLRRLDAGDPPGDAA